LNTVLKIEEVNFEICHFLGVCTQVMHLNKQRLEYYGGNYDAFVRTRGELMENQEKRYLYYFFFVGKKTRQYKYGQVPK